MRSSWNGDFALELERDAQRIGQHLAPDRLSVEAVAGAGRRWRGATDGVAAVSRRRAAVESSRLRRHLRRPASWSESAPSAPSNSRSAVARSRASPNCQNASAASTRALPERVVAVAAARETAATMSS